MLQQRDIRARDEIQGVILERLKTSGLAGQLKVWVRSALAQDLLRQSAGGKNSAASATFPEDALSDATVADHLQRRSATFTLSVLAAECPLAVAPDAVQGVGRLRGRLDSARARLSASVSALGGAPLPLPQQLPHEPENLPPTSSTLPLLPASSGSVVAAFVDFLAAAEAALPTLEAAVRRRRGGEEEGWPLLHPDGVDALTRAAVSAAEARTEARVRAEEAARLQGTIDRLQAEAAYERQRAVEEAGALATTEAGLLARARDDAERGAEHLKERLLGDIESTALRESHTRRAAALDARANALERARIEDEHKRLLARVTDAEDAARHSDVKAALALDRWKTEWLLTVEQREARATAEDRRLRAERDELDSERRALRETLATRAASDAAGEALRAAALTSGVRLEEARREAASARAASDASAAEQVALRSALAAASARATAAEGVAASLEAEKRDWAAAVRTLRDRLAAAASRIKAQAAAAAAADADGSARLALALEGERAARVAAEAVWAAQRSAYQLEAGVAAECLARETRRADEAVAAAAAAMTTVAELRRTRDDARTLRIGISSGGAQPLDASLPVSSAGVSAGAAARLFDAHQLNRPDIAPSTPAPQATVAQPVYAGSASPVALNLSSGGARSNASSTVLTRPSPAYLASLRLVAETKNELEGGSAAKGGNATHFVAEQESRSCIVPIPGTRRLFSGTVSSGSASSAPTSLDTSFAEARPIQQPALSDAVVSSRLPSESSNVCVPVVESGVMTPLPVESKLSPSSSSLIAPCVRSETYGEVMPEVSLLQSVVVASPQLVVTSEQPSASASAHEREGHAGADDWF